MNSSQRQTRMRQTSPQWMFEQMALEHRPRFAFERGADFKAWKTEALPRVLETLGRFPARVAPDPILISEGEMRGVKQQRWLLDVAPHASVVLLVNRPLIDEKHFVDESACEARPTILCWHGHGQFGKDSVMGNDSSPERQAEIARHNTDYGLQMARAGFVTFALDWMGNGDRDDEFAHGLNLAKGRDWCNLYYLHATMLGMTNLGINVSHARAATDFVATLPFVDESQLGVMGLSGGGTLALWSALVDERFRAAEIICYSDLWAAFGFRDTNYCGSQVAPGLFQLVDLPDLQGLLAPRPLLIDIGLLDECFTIDTASQCFARLEPIYEAANARHNLELDVFAGGHAWGGGRSVDFFTRHLGGAR